MKRKFFKKGEYKPTIIDPNDPEVKEMLERTRLAQEKNEKLRKINPDMGRLFIG